MASFSSRLAKALRQGKVVLQNRSNGEVALRYINKEKQKVTKYLAPQATFELIPKHSSVEHLKFSNIEDLQKRRAVRIVL